MLARFYLFIRVNVYICRPRRYRRTWEFMFLNCIYSDIFLLSLMICLLPYWCPYLSIGKLHGLRFQPSLLLLFLLLPNPDLFFCLPTGCRQKFTNSYQGSLLALTFCLEFLINFAQHVIIFH